MHAMRTRCENVKDVFTFMHRQLRRVRRPLDDESTKTLVHAFVTARVDYCNVVLAGTPTSVTDRLQRVLTPLHASSVERASTTVDCRNCYIPTCTGHGLLYNAVV